jgi:predicted GTPase
MKVIEISKQLEEIIIKNDLLAIANPLKNEFAISKSEDLQNAILEMEQDNRVLKIGIVGRVKAGKSSLLNALVFDGKNILPKAATPMTAALTKLEYGEKTEASVDFYTQEDIDDLKIEFDKYNKKVESLKLQKIEELSKKRLNDLKVKELDEENKKDIEQKAKKQANNKIKEDEKLFAYYDQYSRIKESMITISDLENFKNIEAEDIESLNKKLYEFVGADGKYMPFTKSVTIKINDEKLKDIEIIDTPGINDPITSREERTKELLKYCDVILIVSPAGQFLSNEDIELLDRISSKEGIQEIYIIASQIDNQLYASEKEENKGDLSRVLKSISSNLTRHLKETISKQKELYPYQSKLYDKLMKNNVIHSSGATYSILKDFNNKENWDVNLNHVWGNLNENYKDYFSDEESAKINLKNLSNIEKVNEILSEVKIRKDEILKQRKDNFEKTKLEAIFKYKERLQKEIKNNINLIQTSDINEIINKKNNLLKIKIESSEALNNTYEDISESFELKIKDLLTNQVKSHFKKSKESISNSESTQVESWETGMLFWKEQHSREFLVIKAGSVRETLENLTSELEDLISNESKKSKKDLKDLFYDRLTATLREKAGDGNIDIHLVNRTIRNLLNSISYPEIIYTGSIPKELKKTGTLKNGEAEKFMEEVTDYISNFQQRVRNDIKNYISSLIDVLKNQNIGEDIFSSYSINIENLENDINNKELNLAKNQYILKQLENIS